MIEEKVTCPRIETAKLRDKVIGMLKNAFLTGVLKPGDQVVERQLAQQMHVGIHAIREALITLQEQGFVVRIANTATYVTKFTPVQVSKLYAVRTEFELLALTWAKPRVSESQLRSLDEMIEEMLEAASQGDVSLYYEWDLRFHRLCWSLSGNEFLCRSLEMIFAPLIAFVVARNPLLASETEARKHRSLVNALRNLQDPEFSAVVRSTLGDFALSGVTSASDPKKDGLEWPSSKEGEPVSDFLQGTSHL